MIDIYRGSIRHIWPFKKPSRKRHSFFRVLAKKSAIIYLVSLLHPLGSNSNIQTSSQECEHTKCNAHKRAAVFFAWWVLKVRWDHFNAATRTMPLAKWPQQHLQGSSNCLGQWFCAFVLKFAFPPFPPLPSRVQISKRNMQRTFDPINNFTPVHESPCMLLPSLHRIDKRLNGWAALISFYCPLLPEHIFTTRFFGLGPFTLMNIITSTTLCATFIVKFK